MAKLFNFLTGGSKPAPAPVLQGRVRVLVSMHDKVSGAWFPPFVSENDESAVRALVQASSQPGQFRDNYHDYEACIIGNFHDNGTVEPVPFRKLTLPSKVK